MPKVPTEGGARPVYRRSKLGCLQCKFRKVKCDEQKPACSSCKRLNLQCHGYGKTLSKQEYAQEKERFQEQMRANGGDSRKRPRRSTSHVGAPIDPVSVMSNVQNMGQPLGLTLGFNQFDGELHSYDPNQQHYQDDTAFAQQTRFDTDQDPSNIFEQSSLQPFGTGTPSHQSAVFDHDTPTAFTSTAGMHEGSLSLELLRQHSNVASDHGLKHNYKEDVSMPTLETYR